MIYHPSLPEGDENVSKSSFLKALFYSVFGLVLIFFLLGLLVDIGVKMLPEEIEHKYLGVNLDELKEQKFAAADDLINSYLSRLQSCTKLKYPLKAVIVEDEAPNAAALLGGNIIINRGLFSHVRSQNGLMFVLAHEISHFKNKDHLRSLSRKAVFSVATMILLGGSDGLSPLSFAAGLNDIKYSQKQEANADSSALEIMQCYYGHVGGADEFFGSLLRLGEGNAFLEKIFSTHPALKERIEAIKNSKFKKLDTAPLPQILQNIK